MAHELDSQGEWQRLVERYRAMSDGELLQLAAGIGDLTETAGEVLRGEMRGRGLQAAAAVPAVASEGWIPGRGGAGDGEVALMTFFDAIEAGRACDCLEEREIDFEMRDVSRPRSGMLDGSPAVALELFVEKGDRETAKAILRKKMGLFPLQEVEVADEAVDDGTVSTLGGFGRREEAEEVARVLEEAGIWHRVVANPEGTVEEESCYLLEVREMDMAEAGDVVEAALELPEE